jgi:hypothetical protein
VAQEHALAIAHAGRNGRFPHLYFYLGQVRSVAESAEENRTARVESILPAKYLCPER